MDIDIIWNDDELEALEELNEIFNLQEGEIMNNFIKLYNEIICCGCCAVCRYKNECNIHINYQEVKSYDYQKHY